MKRMLGVLIGAAVGLAAFASWADPQAERAGTLQTTTQTRTDLLNYLHQQNQLMIELGGLAAQSTSQKVKELAKREADEHAKLDVELLGYAHRNKYQVKEVPFGERAQKPAKGKLDLLGEKEAKALVATLDGFKALKGAELDRKFLGYVVSEHDKAIERLMRARPPSGDDEYRALNEKNLSALRKHRAAAALLEREVSS